MSDNSFRPAGNTILIAVTSSTATTATACSTGNMVALYVSNPSTSQVFIAFGSSSVQAGNPTTAGVVGMSWPSAFAQVVNVGPSPAQAWLSACTSAGSASIYVTAGTGQ